MLINTLIEDDINLPLNFHISKCFIEYQVQGPCLGT